MPEQSDLWSHVVKHTEHAPLLWTGGDVTKIIRSLHLIVPEPVGKLQCNLEPKKQHRLYTQNIMYTQRDFSELLAVAMMSFLQCVTGLHCGFMFTFSMTPAPRLFMALSFLSGRGGLNWMMFFCRRAKGTVTNTYNTTHNKNLFTRSDRGTGSVWMTHIFKDMVCIRSVPSEQ